MIKVRFANKKDLINLNSMLNYFHKKTDLELEYDKYLIIEEESIIGFLNYHKFYDKIEIQYIFIYEEYRNKGYANTLLKYLIENEEYSDITLEVKVTNEFAIKLYSNNGFKIVSTRPKYYSGIDGYLMHRSR